jgi:hypothetical protein
MRIISIRSLAFTLIAQIDDYTTTAAASNYQGKSKLCYDEPKCKVINRLMTIITSSGIIKLYSRFNTKYPNTTLEK